MHGSASNFLQISTHGGQLCLWLTVPTAKSVADFHRQAAAHAERTNDSPQISAVLVNRFLGGFLIIIDL